MEVAGLVLGAVPIFLEVLKQYRTLLRVCQRFRKCRNGVERLINCLEGQRAIFHNETKLLLIAALGSTIAMDMMRDLEHDGWNERSTEILVDALLDDSKDAIVTAGKNVEESMRVLALKLRELRLDDISTRSLLDKSYRKEIRKRFAYSFSKEELYELSNNITESTSRYRTLRSQIVELAMVKPKVASDGSTNQTLKQVSVTQTVARHVCRMLPKTCKLHTKHFAHFNLKPKYTFSHGAITEIKFQIAYRHLASQTVQRQHDILWFTIESILNGPAQIYEAMTPPGNNASQCKRPVSPSLVPLHEIAERQPKRLQCESPPRTPSPESSKAVIASGSRETATNLELTSDLCVRLRSRVLCVDKTCIGWLVDSTQWKHRFYASEGPCTQVASKDPKSLTALFTKTDGNRPWIGRFPSLRRLEIARLVASAILSYHSTPLTQSIWTSKDIIVYSIDMSGVSGTQPELNAFLEVPMEHQPHETSQQMMRHDLEPFLRNTTLFGLAVIMLELAYQKPLHEMIEASDSKPSWPSHTNVLHAMRRLSKEVSSFLGIQYSKIVEKCLECEFGVGTDLDDPLLQHAIQRDVVSELDQLVTDFERIGLP